MSPSFPPWRQRRLLFEDDELVAVDKLDGVPCHARGEGDIDLATRVSRWLEARGGSPVALGTAIDGAASGVVLLGRSKPGRRAIAEGIDEGLWRRWLAGVTAGAERWRVRERCGPRRLVEREDGARSQPARRWLAEAGAPAAGDREGRGPPCHRLLLHLRACALPHLDRVVEAYAPEAFDDWLHERPFPDGHLEPSLEDALDRRYPLACRQDTDAFRLVHGDGDGIPGVDVDLYGEHAVVSLRSDEALAREERILDAVAALGMRGVYVKRHPKQASRLVDTRRDAVAPARAMRGDDASAPFVVSEAGWPYEVRLGDGLSTGIFLDQRDARAWLGSQAEGKRIANLFCHHGAFTVAAIAGGAAETVSVDSSKPALERAGHNLARLSADRAAHRLLREDAVRFVERAGRRGETFDLVVVDPPSFATSRRKGGRIFRATRDYDRLAASCLKLLSPGGQLLACTNHRGIVPAAFRKMLRKAAQRAGVEIATMVDLPEPSDFPPPPGAPGHLKRVVVEVAR